VRNRTDGIEHSAANMNVDFALNQVLIPNVTASNRPFDLLGVDGTDANDAGDVDSGPNGLQNTPVITSATRYVDAVNEPITLSGTLSSLPNRSFRIAFHQTTVGTLGDTTATLTTDGSGNGSFGPVQVVFPDANVVQVAATATLLDAGTSVPIATSEYGQAPAVATIPPPLDLVVNSTNDPGTGVCDASECTLREAIIAANSNFNPQSVDVIRFDIPGTPDQVHVINVASALPAINETVTIDGYTQPGADPNTDTSGVGSNAQLRIELRGGNFHFNDFVSSGSNVTIKGLSITGFEDPATAGGLGFSGINARLEGCWFGVSPDGTEVATKMVISMDSSSGVFGGDTPAQRNVFANRRALSLTKGRMTNNLVGVLPDGRTAVSVNAQQPGFTISSSGAVLLGSANRVLIEKNVFSTPSGIPAIHNGNVDIVDNAFGESWDGNSTFTLGSAVWADVGLSIRSSTHWIRGALDDAIIVDSSNHSGSILVDQPIVGGAGSGVFHSFGSHLSVRSSVSGTAKIGINLDGGIEDEFGVTLNIGSNIGPNDLQNYPELASAQRGNNGIRIKGTLQDIASTNFRIVVCGIVATHVSAHGGCDEVLDDETIVTSDASGLADIDIVVPDNPIYHFVTATAAKIVTADVEELTSEYALDIPIDDAPIFTDGFEGP
jgi:CSLREA domain-containing protein